jgi:methionyl-tRNA formyltransferase
VSDSIRIVYAGTPDFSVPALTALIDSDVEVVAVYTQPDRPAGRGREPRPSAVKLKALENNIPVFQPESLKNVEAQQCLSELKPDLMIVTAYGLLLPKAVLDIPRLGCINIHASLLPRWRGAAPIQRAILSGDKTTGITIMQMDEGLDTGGMLAKTECAINIDDTGSSLHDRLKSLGAETLMSMLPAFVDGETKAEVQDESLATYASKLSKQEAEIDWSQPAEQLERSVRAYNAWPVAFTSFQKKGKTEMLRVWKSIVVEGKNAQPPGTVISSGRDGIDVVTGEGVLRLIEVQPAGKKPMAAADFANAYNLNEQVLGA